MKAPAVVSARRLGSVKKQGRGSPASHPADGGPILGRVRLEPIGRVAPCAYDGETPAYPAISEGGRRVGRNVRGEAGVEEQDDRGGRRAARAGRGRSAPGDRGELAEQGSPRRGERRHRGGTAAKRSRAWRDCA